MKNRLFYKIFGTYLVIVLLAVVFFYVLGWQQIRSTAVERIEEELTTSAFIIDLSSTKEIERQIETIARISKARITLIDPSGKVIADTEKTAIAENHLNRPEIQEARVRGKGVAFRHSGTLGVDMMYVALPLRENSVLTGYVRLARPLFEVRAGMDTLYRLLVLSFLLMLIPSFLIAVISAYRLAFPLGEMEQYTERLRQGKPPGTLFIRAGDEMKKLADNINYLVGELQSQIRKANDEKEKLVAAFAGMNEGILVLDGENRIEAFNRAFRRMFPSQYGEISGKTLIEAIRNIELQNAFDNFKKRSEQPSAEIAIGGGSPVVLNVSFSRIRGEGEKTLVVFHDVTRLKRLERMRADFVANVTHEIKTPLTAILGFVETLQRGALEDRATALRFLDTIYHHASRLNRLVEDLLTLSDIELGETKLLFESVSLSGIAASVLPIVSARATGKQITLSAEVPEDLPPIRADRDRIVQILLNILDNAIKFTPEGGGVSLRAAIDDGMVSVKIQDSGIGIPRDELARVGERFYRVDKARSRELGGTGLGLSIVKHLMEAHGGRMEMHSELGRGTTVSLFFPIFQE